MQLSECFRQGIVTPRHRAALALLKSNQLHERFLEEFRHINLDNGFFVIWQSGLFHEINRLCSVAIGEFEEEVVEPGCLPQIIDLLDTRYAGTNYHPFYAEFRELCVFALDQRMPVYFVL